MRALVYTRPNEVRVLDVAEPDPAAGEIVLEVAAAGICGSELHGIARPGFRVPPLVMGHEVAGTASDGRRVVVNPLLSCGACDQCASGRPHLCRHRQLVGVHRPGGFAERVAVPESAVHELPAAMSFTTAAVVEPLANAIHAWGLAGDAGARVGVVGAGTIGLVCLLVATDRGAATVTVADPAGDRREGAARLGASTVAARLEGEHDVVFEAVGSAAARRDSLAALRPGGTAVWLGLADSDPGFDGPDLVRGEKRILGSFAYTPAEFEQALADAARLDLDWAQRFPLEDGARIFLDLAGGRTDVVKALLQP